MMEGKFSGEGLQALDTDEDLLSAMARELVEKAGIGESADAVWRELGGERDRVLPGIHHAESESEPAGVLEPKVDLPSPALPTAFGIPSLNAGRSPKRRKNHGFWPAATDSVQLSLFD